MTRRYGRRYNSGSRYESGYQSRQGGRYRRARRSEERHIELVCFGLILALFMIPLLFPAINLNTPLMLILGGVILLGGAFAQSQRRFRVNPITWVGGAAMLVFGILGYQTGSEPLGGLLPFLILGGVLLASFLTGEF